MTFYIVDDDAVDIDDVHDDDDDDDYCYYK